MQSTIRSSVAVLACALLGVGSVWALASDPGPLVHEVFKVSGWTRPDCDEVGVELLIESLEGVDDVEVDYQSGRTVVHYDPDQVSRETIIEEIRNLDYEVEYVAKAGDEDRNGAP